MREKLVKGIIRPLPVRSDGQLDDFFTEALGKQRLPQLLKAFGWCNVYSYHGLRGNVENIHENKRSNGSGSKEITWWEDSTVKRVDLCIADRGAMLKLKCSNCYLS